MLILWVLIQKFSLFLFTISSFSVQLFHYYCASWVYLSSSYVEKLLIWNLLFFSHIGFGLCLVFSLQFRQNIKFLSLKIFIFWSFTILKFSNQQLQNTLFTLLHDCRQNSFNSSNFSYFLSKFLHISRRKVSHFSQHFLMFSYFTACNSHPKRDSSFIYIAAADTKKNIFHMIIIYFLSLPKIRQSKLFSV